MQDGDEEKEGPAVKLVPEKNGGKHPLLKRIKDAARVRLGRKGREEPFRVEGIEPFSENGDEKEEVPTEWEEGVSEGKVEEVKESELQEKEQRVEELFEKLRTDSEIDVEEWLGEMSAASGKSVEDLKEWLKAELGEQGFVDAGEVMGFFEEMLEKVSRAGKSEEFVRQMAAEHGIKRDEQIEELNRKVEQLLARYNIDWEEVRRKRRKARINLFILDFLETIYSELKSFAREALESSMQQGQ